MGNWEGPMDFTVMLWMDVLLLSGAGEQVEKKNSQPKEQGTQHLWSSAGNQANETLSLLTSYC